MVQTKLKKFASGKKHRSVVKNRGKKGDISKFRSQLDSLGLKIIEVTADGNCFFRALADQLNGDENAHQTYRGVVVEYIKTHQEDFEPFIEDEVPFEKYCKSMREDGTWAGNMELQVASLVTRSNICIHHSSSPRWYIRNFHAQGSRMVHIAPRASVPNQVGFRVFRQKLKPKRPRLRRYPPPAIAAMPKRPVQIDM
ncbi:OVARIAN TUMOR DOMAIN-containing deubiquitinating enzyme 7-like [Wolffia australiana]